MFRVSTTPIIRGTQNCNYSLRYCAATSLQRGQAWPRWRELAAQKIWPVPEAVVTALCTPDDGCGWHPKHVRCTCRIINRLLCVASRWTIINIVWSCLVKPHKPSTTVLLFATMSIVVGVFKNRISGTTVIRYAGLHLAECLRPVWTTSQSVTYHREFEVCSRFKSSRMLDLLIVSNDRNAFISASNSPRRVKLWRSGHKREVRWRMGGCAVGTELFRLSTPSTAEIAKRRWECNGRMKHGRTMTEKKGHLKNI